MAGVVDKIEEALKSKVASAESFVAETKDALEKAVSGLAGAPQDSALSKAHDEAAAIHAEATTELAKASSELETHKNDLAKVAADAADLKAKAEADAAQAAANEAAKAAPVVEQVVETAFEAIRNFSARVGTQLLSFTKGERLAHHVGAELHSKGGPVTPVEPPAPESAPVA